MVAALKVLLFALTGPVMIVGVVPRALLRRYPRPSPPPIPLRISALPFWTAGTALIVWTILDLARKGHGTPAPLVPTRELVVSGPYRHARNPMYVGVVSLLLGHTLWNGSRHLLGHAILVALLFHSVVILWEEPGLEQRFAESYARYRREVPRWLPRPGRAG